MSERKSYARTVREPDGSRWYVRIYPEGNAVSREPDGRRTYRTPSIGRSYRDVAGNTVVHWTELLPE
jgi:hypothetical protein